MSFAGPTEAIRKSLSNFLYLPPSAKLSVSGVRDKLLIEYAHINSLNERPNFSMGSNVMMNISVTYPTDISAQNEGDSLSTPESVPPGSSLASVTIPGIILASEDTVLSLALSIELLEPPQSRSSLNLYKLTIDVNTMSLFRSSFDGFPTLSFESLASQLNGTLVKSMSLSGSIQTISASLKLVHYMPPANWNGRSSMNVSLSLLDQECSAKDHTHLESIACTGHTITNQSAWLWVRSVDDLPAMHLATSVVWGNYFYTDLSQIELPLYFLHALRNGEPTGRD